MKRILMLLLAIIIFAGYLTSCKEDEGLPPGLPPYESMIIDFTNFSALKKSAGEISGVKGVNNSNWEYAAGVAGIWETAINTALEVPLASMKITSAYDPGFLSENTWQWSYSFTAGGNPYKARMVGQIRASDVLWQMYVTKEGTGGYTDFLWVEGTSLNDGTGGEWKVKESNASPSELFQIKWTASGTSVNTVEYKYVKSGDFNGSIIKYGLTSGTLNAYYDVHYYNTSKVKFTDADIEWSTSLKNGRVKSTDYLVADVWYYWDSGKINVEGTK